MIEHYKKTKLHNISDIEKFVDEINPKDRTKKEPTNLNLINFENLTPKNTKNKSIFYFKKNNKNNNITQKKLSNEIINKARKNLGEKTGKKKIYEITPELELEKKIYKSKTKIRIRVGKKNRINKDLDKIPNKDNIQTSKEYNTFVSDFEKTIDLTAINNKDERSKFINDKIDNKKEEKTIESGISQITKKNHNLFKNNKKHFLKTFKKDEDHFSFDLDDNSKFLDKNIKKSDGKEILIDYKKEIENLEIPNNKKMFFKKKKSDKPIEYLKNDYVDIKSSTKPHFKVENINNLNNEEKIIIDEGIKKNDNNKTEKNDYKIGEEKAHRLFKEHIKDINDKNIGISNRKNYKNTEIMFAESTGSKNEHVFFDEKEQESVHNSWSPYINENEKKELKDVLTEIDKESVEELNDIELPKETLSIKSVKLSDLGFSENEWEELDFYPLVEPYAYVEVLRKRETLEKCYFLVEAEISEEEQRIMNFIYDTINNMAIDTEDFEVKGENNYLIENVNKIVKDYNINISKELFNKILYNVSRFSFGFGKIDPLMSDPNIEDISCDGNDVPIFVYHRKFGSLKSNIQFNTGDELNSFVYRLAQKCGKHISIAEPMLDATMPDGSRIQMTLSDEITTHGSTFTIRKYRSDPFSPPDLVQFNTMSSEIIAYMWLAVENRINMLFAGGTASGKTTCLNALSLFIPVEAKIVSIEETREINLPHPNWIPGVSRSGFGQVVADKVVGEIDTYDLMKAALRQRPEYIIVGEIRGREAYVLFQAMATGHATYSTVHADSAHSLIHRLEGKPIEIPRIMLQSLDIVSIHIITDLKGKRVRRCKQVIEIIDIDPTTKEILTNEVFRWDPVEDKFIFTGKSYVLERIRTQKDMSRENMTEEIIRRKKIVELMVEQNIRAFRDVARIISRYSEDPDHTLNELEMVIKK